MSYSCVLRAVQVIGTSDIFQVAAISMLWVVGSALKRMLLLVQLASKAYCISMASGYRISCHDAC